MNEIRLKSLSGQTTITIDFSHLANLYFLARQFGWQPAGPVRRADSHIFDQRQRQDATALAALIQRIAGKNVPPEADLMELAAAMLNVTTAAQRGEIPPDVQLRWDTLLDRLVQQSSPGFDPEKFLVALQMAVMHLSGAGYYSKGFAVSKRDVTGLGLALIKALPSIPAISRQVRLIPDAGGAYIRVLEVTNSPDPLDFFGGRRGYVMDFVRFLSNGSYVID